MERIIKEIMMKSLDEVIDAMERCSKTNCFDCNGCPYEDNDAEVGCRSDEMERDALHYLKEYRDHVHYIEVEREDFNRLYAQLNKAMDTNPPLTWDELRTMEGKPVWVEEYYPVMEDEIGATEDEMDTESYWAIISNANKKSIRVVGIVVDQQLFRDLYGARWQAYRKERTE